MVRAGGGGGDDTSPQVFQAFQMHSVMSQVGFLSSVCPDAPMTLVAKWEGSSRLGESRQEPTYPEVVEGGWVERGEKSGDENEGAWFWKVTNPGWGLSIAMMSSRNQMKVINNNNDNDNRNDQESQ